jgi:ketosteroid isomerase-like protein
MPANPALQFIDRVQEAFLEGDPDVTTKSMEADNVRCLQRQYQAIVAGDFAAALDLFTDDVELEIVGPPEMPFAGMWRGREAVGAALRRNFSLVADQQPEIHSVTAQGDTVVVVARERGTYVPTGRGYDLHWVQLFQFRDGRMARVREFADSAALLAAARPLE